MCIMLAGGEGGEGNGWDLGAAMGGRRRRTGERRWEGSPARRETGEIYGGWRIAGEDRDR
jgi:hypothetical protein